MLYDLIRPLVTIVFRIFFRKIYLSNTEWIPKDKPMILAANHPTGFLDPCLLACFLPMPLYSLTRGDVFKSFYKHILHSLNMIPIFRFKDGYANLKNNAATFEYCYDALNNNKTILIFSEGACIMEKRLRPIQKGTARMAFGAWEKYPDLDLYIVPVGVNYTYPKDFRSETMMEVATPIRLQDYHQLYNENPAMAVNQVTSLLSQRLSEKVIIIEKKEDETFTEQLFVLYRNGLHLSVLPVFSTDSSRLQAEREIAARVNSMDPETKQSLSEKSENYFSRLEAMGVQDASIVKKSNTIWNTLILLIGFIPFLIGYVANYVPIWYAKRTADRRVTAVEFYSSVSLAVGFVTWLLYYILLWAIALILGNRVVYFFLLLLPFWGYYSILYLEFFRKWNDSRKLSSQPLTELNSIRQLRKEIVLESGLI